jgi:hypothetical protein
MGIMLDDAMKIYANFRREPPGECYLSPVITESATELEA